MEFLGIVEIELNNKRWEKYNTVYNLIEICEIIRITKM